MNSTYGKPKGVTKEKITGMFFAGVALIHAAAAITHGAGFVTTDLEGTWEIHMLTSGDAPQYTGWAYWTMIADDSGISTVTSIARSNGDSTLPAGPMAMAISPSGIMTVTGTDFHGIMNPQKNMIVATMTDGGGGYNLIVLSKQGTTVYSASDLEGMWNYVGLISGDGPAQTPGWYWGTFTFDVDGDLTYAAPVRDSLGNSDWIPRAGGPDISSMGVLTYPGGLFTGMMNPGKDMSVAVVTMCPGRDTDVCGYNLMVWVKASGTSFRLSHLEGTWEMHVLTSGDAPQYTGWAYGTMIADDSGISTVTSIARSNGDSTLPAGPMAMAISSSGTVTMPGSDFHGIMNSRRDMVVGTMTDGGGGYDLIIYVKADSEPRCPFKILGDLNDDCRVDFADFALMADNWLVDCHKLPDDPACIPQ